MRWRFGAAVALAVVLTGCGSDDAPNASLASTSSLGPTTSSSTVPTTAPCDTATMLPVVRAELSAPGTVEIVSVTLDECNNGYARVGAVPDNSRCLPNGGGSCYDTEQVFLESVGPSWHYLASGSGIDCAHDTDLQPPEMEAACVALGLRTP
jgi:hypothetical protein